MRRVRRSASASPAARLMAVVVLPTPPFWLTTVMVRTGRPPIVPRGTIRLQMFHVEHYTRPSHEFKLGLRPRRKVRVTPSSGKGTSSQDIGITALACGLGFPTGGPDAMKSPPC